MGNPFNYAQAYRFATPINADPQFQQGLNKLADAFTWTPEKAVQAAQAGLLQQQTQAAQTNNQIAQAKWGMLQPYLSQALGGQPSSAVPSQTAAPSVNPSPAIPPSSGVAGGSSLGSAFSGSPPAAGSSSQGSGGGTPTSGMPSAVGGGSLVPGANVGRLLALDTLFPGAANNVVGKLMEPTDAQRAVNALPPDLQSQYGNGILMGAAGKAGGMPDQIRNNAMGWNPFLGKYVYNPDVPKGAVPQFDSQGNPVGVRMLPGVVGAQQQLENASNASRAAFTPAQGITNGGGKYATSVLDQLGGGLLPGNSPQAAQALAPVIGSAEKAYGLPAGQLTGILSAEHSATNATSPAGAQGVAQFMPGTAQQYGVNPTNDFEAVGGAAKYLNALNAKYGDPRLAAMAYNWGPGNVDGWIKAGGDPAQIPSTVKSYVQAAMGPLQPSQAPSVQAPNAPAVAANGRPMTELPPQIAKANEADAGRLDEFSREADPQDVQRVALDIGELRNVLKNFKTGAGGEAGQALANVANRMGIATPQGFNPTDAATFQKLATDLVSNVVRSYGGQVRNVEFTTAAKANPDISLPVDANLRILDNLDAANRYRQQLSQAATNYFNTNGSLGHGQFEADYNAQHPMTDTYNAILREYGGKAAPVAAPGAGIGGAVTTPSQPPAGAKQAPDGNFYVPDPARPGKWLMVQ